MTKIGHGFRDDLRREISAFVEAQKTRFPEDECLKIDLHCHDHNSNVPDEVLGRILRWPETWVPTDDVVKLSQRNGMTALTITNHNNARSCYDLLDRGVDVLVGSEFTCPIPEYGAQVHILTYGFTPEQESRLLALRSDIYRFVEYTCEHDIVTAIAHPLYFYSNSAVPPIDLLEKLTLLFDNFEVINGQRDTWQNLLVNAWLDGLDEERLTGISKRTGIPIDAYCRRPYDKAKTAGSDDHMAMFVGTTGSRVHVPGLAERLKREPPSTLVLEGLRSGRVAPFGSYTEEEKLAAALLDYFCQVVRNAEDPGLLRLMLHQGTPRQKSWAFFIANAMFELRRHRYTFRFTQAAHEAIHGKHLGKLKKYVFAREFRPIIKELNAIARVRAQAPQGMDQQLRASIPAIFNQFSHVIGKRIEKKVDKYERSSRGKATPPLQELIERFEVPLDSRVLFGGGRRKKDAKARTASLRSLTEGLPFPALAAFVLAGSIYTSARVQFASRRLLDDVANAIDRYQHPRRMLWLTDTLFDRNGVATVLRLMHEEVVRRDLPIDFVTCHPTESERDHLHVVRPVAEFTLPFYEQQPIRIFDIVQVQKIFLEGGYDRIICSTEGLMGMAAMYLKSAFAVPAFFYIHTDWIDFARRTLNLDVHFTDRVRRMLRAYYRGFDGLFVLNSEHLEWLASDAMGFSRGRLRMTAHWIDGRFGPHRAARSEVFPGLAPERPIVLFVGRVSDEKGVMELPAIVAGVRQRVPNTQLVVVGTGPAEARLRAAMPDATYLSWVDHDRLSRIYPAADLLLLPSRFDTFGCVVLEAMASGLPVVAYRTKGPRDIIDDGVSGRTVESQAEFIDATTRILGDRALHARMRRAAIDRAGAFRADDITDTLLADVGLLGGESRSFLDEPPLRVEAVIEEALDAWAVEQSSLVAF